MTEESKIVEEFTGIVRALALAIDVAEWKRVPDPVGEHYEGQGNGWRLVVAGVSTPAGMTYDGAGSKEGTVCRMPPGLAYRAFRRAKGEED